MKSNLKFGLLAALLVLAVFAIAGHPLIPADMVAGLGAAGMIPFAGEIDAKGIKELLDKQGTAWEEFKKTNDARMKALEEGKGVAEFEGKLSKINTDLAEIGKELKEVALKAQRPQVSGDREEKAAKELKSFNGLLLAEGKNAPLTAEGYAAYKQAMNVYVRKGMEALTPEQQKAINVGTASQGGYLIGEEMEAGIDRVVGNYSAMRQVATVRSIGQASYKKLVKTSGTSGGTRGGERTTTTEGTSPTWAELEFRTGTFLSEQRISSEALEDSVQDVEADLTEEIGMEFAEMEGDNFIDGTGVNGPRGFLDYDIVINSSYAWAKVGYTKTAGAAGFAASNPSDALIDLQHSLKRQYRAGAMWMMNDATLAAIRKFKDGNGIYLWAPSGLLQGAVGQLLGHAVMTDDFMPDLGANTYPIAFADFKRAYYVIDRKGISILRDPFTNHPQVTFKARKRVGGGIANFEAIKIMKCEA